MESLTKSLDRCLCLRSHSEIPTNLDSVIPNLVTRPNCQSPGTIDTTRSGTPSSSLVSSGWRRRLAKSPSSSSNSAIISNQSPGHTVDSASRRHDSAKSPSSSSNSTIISNQSPGHTVDSASDRRFHERDLALNTTTLMSMCDGDTLYGATLEQWMTYLLDNPKGKQQKLDQELVRGAHRASIPF